MERHAVRARGLLTGKVYLTTGKEGSTGAPGVCVTSCTGPVRPQNSDEADPAPRTELPPCPSLLALLLCKVCQSLRVKQQPGLGTDTPGRSTGVCGLAGQAQPGRGLWSLAVSSLGSDLVSRPRVWLASTRSAH